MRSFFFGFLLFVASPAIAFDVSKMSEDDRTIFNSEVRAYLMDHPEIIVEAVELLQMSEEERRVAIQKSNAQYLNLKKIDTLRGLISGEDLRQLFKVFNAPIKLPGLETAGLSKAPLRSGLGVVIAEPLRTDYSAELLSGLYSEIERTGSSMPLYFLDISNKPIQEDRWERIVATNCAAVNLDCSINSMKEHGVVFSSVGVRVWMKLGGSFEENELRNSFPMFFVVDEHGNALAGGVGGLSDDAVRILFEAVETLRKKFQ